MKPALLIPVFIGLAIFFFFLGIPGGWMRFLGRNIAKVFVGMLMLYFLNAIINPFGIHIPINIISCLISGFLGIPGMGALVAINLWIL